MGALGGRHALVTGGGSGIGAAIATTLVRAGASVTICGRRLEALQDVAAAAANIRPVVADVTDEASVAKLYGQAEVNGPIDIVVANAGGAESAPVHKTSLELWNRTLNVNLTGAFLSVRPALAGMRERRWGRIVFVASTGGLKGYAYVAPYVAAKHGVIGLMRTLALEAATAGITVNAVCPGFTETPLIDRALETIVAKTDRSPAEARGELAKANPQGRLVKPEEVADAILWLASPGSASINGQAIVVAGGEVMAG
jgi:NAD(P)-dependent dehydrogenase (short-subunit alcohol dehydrogenase family)